jgi:outer membrane protein assembly factor BamB
LINLILAPGYVREPFDNATIFIDATNRARTDWLGDLGRALGLSRTRGSLSRRSLLGLGAAAITTIAATGAAGAFLLDYRAQSARVAARPGDIRWHVPASTKVLPTPEIAGAVVYATSETGAYALSLADGHTLWHSAGFIPKQTYGQPVIEDSTFYSGVDSTVYALRASDGGKLWSADLSSQEGQLNAGPVGAGGVLYTLSDAGFLTAWSAKDGSRRWSVQTTNDTQVDSEYISGPATDGATVYMGSLDHTLYAFEANNGAVKWKYVARGPIVSTPAVADGVVYFGGQDAFVYALNAKDGTLRWKFKAGRDIYSSPAVAGGVVYIGSDDYYLYALDGATGALYWKAPAGDLDDLGLVQDGKQIRGQPTVEGGIVAVTADDTVYSLNVRDGSRRWRWKPQVKDTIQPVSDCAIVDGLLCVGAKDQSVYLIGA